MNYKRKSPCNNCPYRIDAPLKLWHIEEFKKLLHAEGTTLGRVYGCHKNDNHVCVGWLIDQDKRYFPSLSLRIDLSRNNVDRSYLNNLKSPVPLYNSIREMAYANYPQLKLLKDGKSQ